MSAVHRHGGAPGLEDVYEARGIPTHSCLLVTSRQEALAHPTGDLALGWCGTCGFSCNRAFDASASVARSALGALETAYRAKREPKAIAELAVRVACKFDNHCGLPLESHTVDIEA